MSTNNRNKNKKLLDALNTGDNETMKELLYKELLPKVVAYITSNKGRKEDAYDIFQDVTIMMVKKVRYGRFTYDDDLLGYMFLSVRNGWINKIQKDSRSSSLDTVEYEHQVEELKQEWEIKERENDILAIFSMLGDKCAELLRLLIIDEKTTEEVAEALGISGPKVVKTSKNRCKNRLIELIEGRQDIKQMLLRNDWRFNKYI